MAESCLSMVLAGLLAVPQGDGEPIERLAAVAATTRDELGVANLVVGLALAGEPVFAEGWGYADPAGQVPAAAEGALPAGALTPALVTLGVLMLVDDGALQLEDPLSRHFGGELGELSTVTVEQLLRHTSGLPPVTAAARGDLLAWLAEQPLEHAPGTCASYSGGNTYWLLRLLEARAGQSVAEFVRERIASPLALEATDFAAARAPVRSAGESRLEVVGGDLDDPSLAYCCTAGELRSSALDLLDLVHALAAGRLVSDAALRFLCEPAPLPDGTAVTFVGGFSRTSLGDHAGWSLGGALWSGNVHAAWYPEIELAAVALSTDESAPLALIERRLTRAFLCEVGPELLELELPEESLARYVGGYFVGCLSYQVEARSGHLWLVPSDGRALRLGYVGGDSFSAAGDPDLRIAFEVADDRAQALVLDEHGFVTVATRME